jgi:APA family basic amino acid/polyamine antiporter
MNIFRIKNIMSVKEVTGSGQSLNKTLTAFHLLLLGIGAVIGTGIFVITGTTSQVTGPALFLSFLLSGIACVFVALVYTEIAAAIPTSGSVYTYSYIALGEYIAWITGALLVLEFGVGPTVVAAGWSAYVTDILKHLDIIIPFEYTTVPSNGGIVNLPAMIITFLITCLLIKGTKESALLNNILVVVKLAAILLFVFIAVPHFDLKNWEPFAPFGFNGIAQGGAMVFIAFAGFDSLAAAADECKNPKRDITIGLIGSLIICTILYVIVAAVLTGIVPYTELNNEKPLAHALRLNGSSIGSALVAAGGIAGMTTVLIVQIYAQSRVFYAMARDGLLPKSFTKLHPRFNTPYVSTIVTGLAVSLCAGFFPINTLNSLTNMGTLSVFIIASIVVVVLRHKNPELERPFKCPAIYLISSIAILLCGYLLYQLIPVAGVYYVGWLLFCTAIYFLYSYKSSNLNNNTI